MGGLSDNPRSFDRGVLEQISNLRGSINNAAKSAGLRSDLFIAAPIAREMNKDLFEYGFFGDYKVDKPIS
ncbi:MAG: hypothetical protein H7Y09_12725 [Chitinophagaceae bacterium]|nr:hypothetical protein [Anaerolineae bacterium]